MVGDAYFYLLIALFLPLFFLIAPMRKKLVKERVPLYDVLFALLSFIAPMYLFFNATRILEEGWEIIAPIQVYILGLILMVLVLEASREGEVEVGGLAVYLPFFCLLCPVCPTYAGFIRGIWLRPSATGRIFYNGDRGACRNTDEGGREYPDRLYGICRSPSVNWRRNILSRVGIITSWQKERRPSKDFDYGQRILWEYQW